MTSKSKNNHLFLILAICIGLFIVAFFFKNNFNTDNTEKVNVIPKQQTMKSFDVNDKDLSFLDDDIIIQDVQSDLPTEQEKIDFKKKLSKKLNYALMYKTPESIMKSVVYYQENGNLEEVDSLISFLLEQFPEYELPEY